MCMAHPVGKNMWVKTCAVIEKFESTRLEGTPTMDLELKGIRTHRSTDTLREIEQNAHP